MIVLKLIYVFAASLIIFEIRAETETLIGGEGLCSYVHVLPDGFLFNLNLI